MGGFAVYELDTNEGLLWYRVGVKRWVAENPKITFKMYKDSL